MDSPDRIDVARRSLRYDYNNDLPGLKALYLRVRDCAFTHVEITGIGHQGNSSNGQLVFERMEYLSAVLDILAEIDPNSPPPAPIESYVRSRHPTVLDPRFVGVPPGY